MTVPRPKLLTALVVGLLTASALGVAAQDDEDAPSASPVLGPVGVIAIGHSGLTGENTDPNLPPFSPVLENSWATGTNP